MCEQPCFSIPGLSFRVKYALLISPDSRREAPFSASQLSELFSAAELSESLILCWGFFHGDQEGFFLVFFRVSEKIIFALKEKNSDENAIHLNRQSALPFQQADLNCIKFNMVSELTRFYTVFQLNYYCRNRVTSEVSHYIFFFRIKNTSQLMSVWKASLYKCSKHQIYAQNEQRSTIWKFHLLLTEWWNQTLHRCCSMHAVCTAPLTKGRALLM